MNIKEINDFESKLGDASVGSRRVGLNELSSVVSELVTKPAVGVVKDAIESELEDGPVTLNPTPSELEAAQSGVTIADLAIADYGTVALPECGDGSELVSLFVNHHVAIVRASDIVPDMETAFERLDRSIAANADSAILATGPSATADMGALVKGAHGPRAVDVIIVEEA